MYRIRSFSSNILKIIRDCRSRSYKRNDIIQNDISDIFLHFYRRDSKALLFLFPYYSAIYARPTNAVIFRFCFRRILGNTCCPRICIQARRYTNATFAKGTIRNRFERISRKNFARICWKRTATRFLRLATRTTM